MDVRVHNSYADTSVRVTISGENGTLVEAELNVSRNETAFADDLPVTKGEYELTVSTAEAARSFNWEVNDGCDRLTVTIREDGGIRIQYVPRL